MSDSNDLMTVADVAEYLKVAERTVYSWAQQGRLPGGISTVNGYISTAPSLSEP